MSWKARIFGTGWRVRPSSELAAYAQIEEQIADRIATGELHPGEPPPAERERARGRRVSRMKARPALASLAGRGLVDRGGGRGAFVSSQPVEHAVASIAGFPEQLARHGLTATATIRNIEVLS